jgi:hypothetical protein
MALHDRDMSCMTTIPGVSMKKVLQPLAWYLVLTSVVAMASGVALSVVTNMALAASIDHHHGASEHLPLPPPGQKWATDAPLREGMAHIRKALEQALPISQAPISDAQATELSQAIETEVASMISHCTLPEKADATLHGLLGELLQGSEALRADADRKQAMLHLLVTLNRYPQLFDDPAWQALAVPDQH